MTGLACCSCNAACLVSYDYAISLPCDRRCWLTHYILMDTTEDAPCSVGRPQLQDCVKAHACVRVWNWGPSSRICCACGMTADRVDNAVVHVSGRSRCGHAVAVQLHQQAALLRIQFCMQLMMVATRWPLRKASTIATFCLKHIAHCCLLVFGDCVTGQRNGSIMLSYLLQAIRLMYTKPCRLG